MCTDAQMTADAPTRAQLVEMAEEHAVGEFQLRRFRRFAHIEAYIASVVTGPWWCERFPDAPLEVLVERRSRSATYSAAGTSYAAANCNDDVWGHATAVDPTGIIWLVDGAGWGLETVLHELAHLAAETRADHGPAFTDALGELWRHEAGVEAWAALQQGFARSGISVPCDHPDDAPPAGSPRPRPHP